MLDTDFLQADPLYRRARSLGAHNGNPLEVSKAVPDLTIALVIALALMGFGMWRVLL